MEYFVINMHILVTEQILRKGRVYNEYTIRTKQSVNRSNKLPPAQTSKPAFRLSCSIFLCGYYYMHTAVYYNFFYAMQINTRANIKEF